MNPKLIQSIEELNLTSISNERKLILNKVISYIQNKQAQNEPVLLNFICTHNSRRSHLSQIWAQTLAAYFKVDNVTCYSGGTEATALFPKIVETLTQQGFEITTLSENPNPVYSIKFGENVNPIIGFSKKMDHPFNPASHFAAIMTCSQADEGCPFVPGAEKRIPLTYDDPKAFDNTPQMDQKYLERSIQIATDMMYIFSQVD